MDRSTRAVVGVIFLLFGLLYVRYPGIYRRGTWLRTSLAIRFLSEENYRKYIKGLGWFFILAGNLALLSSAVGQ